ncbi:hypothetical protein J7384_18650 [Endozoicomonas sp. G2_1]|uniref:CsiV family protein n=1 Tax=Endozoicomonas sp. G2_1 TaxID=2821091 RepID=UPI001ADB9D4A|nr:CsiV family protein [Endozoicomonas sp. G2_1]MBO9492389.1 hypothetical protein [Endozoicomonas sp. G2_1]
MKLKSQKLLLSIGATTFALSLGAFGFSPNANAAEPKKERWFEMEVILFSQLNDKSTLKENFPSTEQLSDFNKKYRRVNDLLTPFLYPELTSLKALLPVCGQAAEPSWQQQIQSYQYAPIKSLSEIEQTTLLSEIDYLDREQSAQQSLLLGDNSLDSSDVLAKAGNETSSENNANQNAQSVTTGSFGESFGQLVGVPGSQINPTDNSFAGDNSELADITTLPFAEQYGFTQAEVSALVVKAEQYIDNLAFSYNGDQGQVSKQFCALAPETIAKLSAQISDYDPDFFPIDKMPRRIDATEDIYSDQPYLLSSESLELTDIYQALRRSKEFRPLLHIGWRQPAVAQKQSIPMRLFAGDNFQQHYRDQLSQYRDTLASNIEQEQSLQALFDNNFNQNGESQTENDTTTPELSEQALKEEKIKAALADIYQNIDSLPQDTQTLLSQLESDADNALSVDQVSNTKQINEPKAPLQPWYIDGLFNVHLNHYLYITADFNIYNQPLAQQITKALTASTTNNGQAIEADNSVELVRFEQNRRVISKQIHYFDHPYMGMVVQIRRYQRPEPETAEQQLSSDQQ